MTIEGPGPRSRVTRLPAKARYDTASIHAVLDAGYLCHVGFALDGQPAVIPTLYAGTPVPDPRLAGGIPLPASAAAFLRRRGRGSAPA